MEDFELVEFYYIFVVAMSFDVWELQCSIIQYENLIQYVIRIPMNIHFETSGSQTSVRWKIWNWWNIIVFLLLL